MQKAAFQRSRHLAPGDKLGKYEVIRQIAVGGMAELYLARTTGIEGFEKLVVVKRILPQYVANSSFVDMFLNEARLAATLHHPNVAQVYDIGVEDGDYFFAMEYVHGEDLDHMHIAAEEQGVPISMDAALTLVAGLCAGLHYAHDKASPEGRPLGIVHRDVSPSNVLVSYDGAVKLVDFGIARAASRPGTTQGGLKGKIAYMSPEQCKSNKTLDRRSDIYSVGTILYQLTTGRMPFKGETEYQVLNQIVNDDVPPPSTVVPNYPPALAPVVMKALQRDPDKRYRNALELQSAVEDFAHESRLRVSPLVLARLMGTLFPTRLEEWDHAKAQGAFFVEQHVVRTLIESGRTPDRSDPVIQAKVAAAALSDDDPTQINTTFSKQPLVDLGDTTVGADPISTEAATTPSIPSFANQRPSQPQAYPVIGSPGVLVSSTAPTPAPIPVTPRPIPFTPTGGAVQATPSSIDVTERVRAPVAARQTSPTKFVRTGPSRKGVFILATLIAAAGGIAVFIVTRGNDAPMTSPAPRASSPTPTAETPTPTPTAETPTPTPVEPAVPTNTAAGSAANDEIEIDEPTTPEPVAEKAEPAKVAPTEPTKVEPTKVEPEPKPEPVAAKTEPKKTVVAKRPKTAPKTEPKKTPPKEKTWNSDSPFMPVRTGK